MADLLTIGASASQLYKSALSTVSNNIANLTTEGYSRQTLNITDNKPDPMGSSFIGTGATLDSVSRAYSSFAESNLRQSKGELSTQDQLIDYAGQIVDVMGSESAGLNQAMDRFFVAAGDLSVDPASLTLRSSFLNEASGLAFRFNELAGFLSDVETNSQYEIDADLTKLNDLTKQLVLINTELQKNTDTSRQPPGLLDQRDRTLLQMAEIAKIHITENKAGAVDVRLGDARGTFVIDNNQPNQFSAVYNQPQIGDVNVLSSFGVVGPISDMSGGSLGGLMNVRSQVLKPTIAQLDNLADTLTAEVNAIQEAGFDSGGVDLGQPMFGNDGVTTGAAGLTLLLNDPAQIAAALQANSPGDNSNMLLMARLQTESVMADGGSLTDGYNSIVTSVGSQATLAKISKDALQVVYDQAVADKDRVSGVSLDEEAADLIRYQQAFQASAKIIEVSSKLFDSILAMR
jgi:flagellar hook-associated protein FlgK